MRRGAWALWGMVAAAVTLAGIGRARAQPASPGAATIVIESAEDAADEAAPPDVEGAPRTPPRGRLRTEPVPEPASDERGIPEHTLHVVPRGTPQPAEALSAEPATRSTPAWPGPHLRDGARFPGAWSYPELHPGVDASLQAAAGGGDGATFFGERLEVNLYLLQLGVSALRAADEARVTPRFFDADLRLPLRLGAHRLALLPGAAIPIDSERPGGVDTGVRLRALWGYGDGPLSLQLGGGWATGPRSAGLLGRGLLLDATAVLADGLAEARLLRHLALRLEVSGQLALDPERRSTLTLLPGVTFFPLGDERLELAVSAIAEGRDRRRHLVEDPLFGGLLHLELGFY